MTEDKLKILIVDDNNAVRKLLTTIVKEENCEPYEAVDGQQAIQLADTVKPGLIFVDLRMPVMDGVRAIEQLRHTFDLKNIVIMSAYNQGDYAFKLPNEEMFYITKPFNVEIIRGIVRKRQNNCCLYE